MSFYAAAIVVVFVVYVVDDVVVDAVGEVGSVCVGSRFAGKSSAHALSTKRRVNTRRLGHNVAKKKDAGTRKKPTLQLGIELKPTLLSE